MPAVSRIFFLSGGGGLAVESAISLPNIPKCARTLLRCSIVGSLSTIAAIRSNSWRWGWYRIENGFRNHRINKNMVVRLSVYMFEFVLSASGGSFDIISSNISIPAAIPTFSAIWAFWSPSNVNGYPVLCFGTYTPAQATPLPFL